MAASRNARGLTQAEVAKVIGLKSGQSVWDWENDKGSGIPADMLFRLVKLYRVSPGRAAELLIQFHEDRIRQKVGQKIEKARKKAFGRKR